MYNKNLTPSLQFIDKLTQEKVTIPNLPFENKEGQFIFEESFPSFLLSPKDDVELFTHLLSSHTWCDSLEVSTKSTKSGSYKIHQATLSTSTPKNPSAPIDANNKCCIRFRQLMDSRWDEEAEYFYRLFLPIKEHNWRDLVHSTAYYQHSVYRSTPTESLIRIDFGGGRTGSCILYT